MSCTTTENIKPNVCHVSTHSVCLVYRAMPGKRPKFNCPQCRKEIVIPGGRPTVDSLPNNFLVENLREYQDLINHSVLCGDRDDENQAVSFCHDCGLFLCQGCVDGHRQRRSQRHHKLSTMQELQQQKHHPRKEQVCPKHPTQTLNLYCKDDTCKIPVCASCGLVNHRTHELVDLTAATEEIVAEIKQSLAKVNGTNQELQKRREKVVIQQDKLAQNSEQKIKDIDELEKKLIKLIESKSSQAKVHVKQLYETEMKKLTTKIESIDNITAQMTNACEFATKACDMNHPAQLLKSQHQIIERLRELGNTVLPQTTSDKTDFTFTDNHESALDQIQKSMQHLYDVAECKPQVDPKKCTIQLGLPEHGGYMTARIQTVDTNGQLITTGGANVMATQDGNESCQRDNKDGTYSLTYNPYLVGKIRVTINGTPMIGSPFQPQK